MPSYAASQHIELPDARSFKAAIDRSFLIGTSPNLFLTINLEQIGVAPEQCCQEWKNLRDKIQRSYKSIEHPFSCLWVFENSTASGVHVHALIHTPQQPPKKTLESIFAKHFKPRPIPIRAIKKSPITELNGLVDYCLKGIRPCHANFINRAYEPQGQIIGRRIHWTRNLSSKKEGTVKSLKSVRVKL